MQLTGDAATIVDFAAEANTPGSCCAAAECAVIKISSCFHSRVMNFWPGTLAHLKVSICIALVVL